jgi:hypothetical protein
VVLSVLACRATSETASAEIGVVVPEFLELRFDLLFMFANHSPGILKVGREFTQLRTVSFEGRVINKQGWIKRGVGDR